MEQRVINEFKTTILRSTKIVKIMNKFEGIDSDVKYNRIVIENMININGGLCHLVIERAKSSNYTGDITFCDYRDGKTEELIKFLKGQISKEVVAEYSGKKKLYRFKKPYHLRAQTSKNRDSISGWYWDWSDGVGSYIEGDEYGNTNDYIFAGVYIE